MKNLISIKAIIILSIFFFNVESSYALDNPTDPEEEEDVIGEVPVDDYIVPMLIAGVGFAYILTKKQIKRA